MRYGSVSGGRPRASGCRVLDPRMVERTLRSTMRREVVPRVAWPVHRALPLSRRAAAQRMHRWAFSRVSGAFCPSSTSRVCGTVAAHHGAVTCSVATSSACRTGADREHVGNRARVVQADDPRCDTHRGGRFLRRPSGSSRLAVLPCSYAYVAQIVFSSAGDSCSFRFTAIPLARAAHPDRRNATALACELAHELEQPRGGATGWSAS